MLMARSHHFSDIASCYRVTEAQAPKSTFAAARDASGPPSISGFGADSVNYLAPLPSPKDLRSRDRAQKVEFPF